MTEVLLLVGWIVAGAALAAVFVDETRPWWTWAPMAVVFGPLWILIAVDQRAPEPDRVAVTRS